jgi:hypothetical protein
MIKISTAQLARLTGNDLQAIYDVLRSRSTDDRTLVLAQWVRDGVLTAEQGRNVMRILDLGDA